MEPWYESRYTGLFSRCGPIGLRPYDPAVCRWVGFRRAGTGEPWWVPDELAFLNSRPGERPRIAAAVSTGLSCGRPGHPVLLRGLQEVIERDTVVGAWWGRYPLDEWDP